MSLPAVALLELLEKTTGWVYYHFCYHLGSRCACMGAFPPSWSQVVGESPGCRATASSGGMTAPGTSAAGMSGYLPPPPGLPPIDFSKWRLPPPEAPASRGPTAPPNLPGVGRSARLRGTVKRIVGAPHPGRLAQQMPAPPMLTPCTPQMALPLQQPRPEQPVIPYQQAVQPPMRPAGRGVIADTPTDKTTPVGGTTQDHGRPTTRGQGHGSQSISCPRGAPGTASVQLPCQEGDLPSGLTPSAPPPPPAPERTQPQRGGQTRSTLCDPTWLAANFCSSGWRKDLEHILQVYYRYSVGYFTEADWVRVKKRFFDHFLQHKGEALALKEARPMDFMAYIQDLIYQATGLHLDGLTSFTGWIKWGSYYHGIVAQQGCLHECLHLMGAPMPRWPQVSPSESRRESQMKSDAQVHSSSRPSAGATVAPVAETPVVEVPVAAVPVEVAPITEASIGKAQGAEALVAPSSPPAPMETGGVGDGQSWAKQVEVGEESFQRSRPAKHACSPLKRCELKPWLPFPLQDSEGRLASILQLYEHAAAQPATPHNVAGQAIMHLHPDLLPQKAMSLGNQVSCMIAEYHLTASARQSSLHPIIPEEAAPLLPPLKSYIPGVAFEGTQDVRVVDHATALQVAVWLHQLDMAVGGEALASESLEALWHHLDPLLESFLTPRTSNLTYKEVVDRVLTENCRASEESLHHLKGHRIHNRGVLDGFIKVHGELDKADKATRKSLKKEIDQRRKSLETLRSESPTARLNLVWSCLRVTPSVVMAKSAMVHRPRWLLLLLLLMTLLQRAPPIPLLSPSS